MVSGSTISAMIFLGLMAGAGTGYFIFLLKRKRIVQRSIKAILKQNTSKFPEANPPIELEGFEEIYKLKESKQEKKNIKKSVLGFLKRNKK